MGKTILSSGAAWALAFATSVALAADEPPRMSLSAVTIGALGRTDLAIGMLEARAVLSPYLFVSAAPTLVAVEGGRH